MNIRMFRMAASVTMMLASTALVACGNVPGGVTPATGDTGTQVSQIVQQIQAAAVKACQFQPTFSTVTNIVASFTSVGAEISSVNDVAAQICAAIAVPKSARRGGAAPAFCTSGVMGEKCVAIHGKWR